MKYKLSKLSLDSSATLSPFSLDDVEAFRPISAPVYLLMSKNSKYVSIKGPLDFFSPKDISKLSAVKESLFVGEFYNRVKPYKDAAQKIKNLLNWTDPNEQKSFLEITPYEQSNELIQIIGKLWSEKKDNDNKPILAVESYFAAILGADVCEPLPGDPLIQAREMDIDRYELGILRSGVFVFFALHLGYMDLPFLSELRRIIFLSTVDLLGITKPIPVPHELEQLRRWVETVVPNAEVTEINTNQFLWSLNRSIQKIKWRLERVKNEIVDRNFEMPTVYGTGGVYENQKDTENDVGEQDVG